MPASEDKNPAQYLWRAPFGAWPAPLVYPGRCPGLACGGPLALGYIRSASHFVLRTFSDEPLDESVVKLRALLFGALKTLRFIHRG